MIDDLDKLVDEFHDLKERGFEMRSDFPSVDKYSYGWRRGRIYIIGGAPGSGKTSFATFLAQRTAYEQDKKVLFFSLEMGLSDMVGRLTSILYKVPHYRIQQPWTMCPEDFLNLEYTINKLKDGKFTLICNCMDIKDIIARIELDRPDLVVLDHLQYLPIKGKANNDKMHDIITGYVMQLRECAKKNKCAMMVLSQKKRSSVPGSPALTDFSGSAGIEQQADLAIMIERPVKDDGSVINGEFDLHIVKNRNGITGRIKMTFNPETLHYGELYKDPMENIVNKEKERLDLDLG